MGQEVLALATTVGGVTAARWLVALLAAAASAWCDSRTRRIPNIITFPTFIAGLCVALVLGGLSGLGDSLSGALLLGIPYFLLFAFAGGGAGDAKLMAAIGAWVGWHDSFFVLAAVAISGGALAILYAILKKQVGGVAGNLRTAVFGLGLAVIDGGRVKQAREFMPAKAAALKMPYGLAIFVGTALAAGWVMLWK